MGQASALQIRYPRSRLDKLGVKPESVLSVVNVTDPTFRDELESRGVKASFGRTRKSSTLIVYGVDTLPHLDKLTALRETITQDGAIWVVWPKGRKRCARMMFVAPPRHRGWSM